MSVETRSETALVLFSGGQDSTTCLAWALDRFDRLVLIERHAESPALVGEEARATPPPVILLGIVVLSRKRKPGPERIARGDATAMQGGAWDRCDTVRDDLNVTGVHRYIECNQQVQITGRDRGARPDRSAAVTRAGTGG